jgi:hypothetical protein
VLREYTSRGKVSLIRYLDAEGNGTMVKGVYGIKSDYNSFGNLEKETWLDQDGRAALNEDGYASIQYDYDLSDSSKVEKYYSVYLDETGAPTMAKNGAWGITELYYPVTRIHTVTYIDDAGEPVVTTDGYAILEYELNDQGNRVWEGYYDAAYAQTNCADGYSNVERGYDQEGRLISERYVDRYNKLTNNKNGVAGWTGRYDENGELIITSCYDKNRNPVSIELLEIEEVENEEPGKAA